MIIGLQMKGAELQAEQAAGNITDPGAQQTAAEDIYRVVYADIDLRIRDQESPGKYESPPAAGMPEG